MPNGMRRSRPPSTALMPTPGRSTTPSSPASRRRAMPTVPRSSATCSQAATQTTAMPIGAAAISLPPSTTPRSPSNTWRPCALPSASSGRRRCETTQATRLPNADQAAVDLDKLRGYCLNPAHPRGRHKARVFAAALGRSVPSGPGRRPGCAPRA
ncbi:DUF6883 domain-containing protein [uncultured Thiohalocapsa sp.]|uniref:DUF6883 domain-containing protein n=1 Tax=uncultured Thiohalocapsa sp. TaxID=768990 RepID=UPI00345D720C